MAKLKDEELAALTGFTVAFFKSNNQLEEIWNKAKKNQWDPARILAAMRQTKWFRRHSEAQRQAKLLKESDPSEYRRRRLQVRANVGRIQRETGLGISIKGKRTRQIRGRVALLAFTNQWNDQQIKNFLARYSAAETRVRSRKFATTGLLAQGENLVRQLSYDYGVPASRNLIANLAKGYAKGSRTDDGLRNYFLQKAKSTYAGVAGDLDSGLTTRQIAEPYIDAMARLWEQNPNDIDVRHSMIRKALTRRGKDNKPSPRAIWQFEEDLRQSSRWKSTNNGREAIFATGNQVLKDFGLAV